MKIRLERLILPALRCTSYCGLMFKPRALFRKCRIAFRKVPSDNRGATAIEYGLLIALVVIAMMVGLTALGVSTSRMWDRVDGNVSNAMGR